MASKTNKIEITINDKKTVSIVKDSFLLEPVRKAGFVIPSLCHHKDLTPTGICRLCVCEVEVRGRKRMVTACNYPVRQEIKVYTDSPRVKAHRKMLAEMYLGRWPKVPIIQEIAEQCGATDSTKFKSG